jgi:hypothetical protein
LLADIADFGAVNTVYGELLPQCGSHILTGTHMMISNL